jgi:transposase-like protein
VARDLALTESSLRTWVERAQADRGKGKVGVLTTAEREELADLRKEVRTLRMERDILKKAAVGSGGERNAPMVDKPHGENWTPWAVGQREGRSLGKMEMRAVAQ